MKAKPGFNIRNVCGQDLIVAEGEENIDFSNIISMNESSAFLWKKIQPLDSFTVQDMAKYILDEYEIDENTAIHDCEKLASQWAQAGIIEGDDIPVVKSNGIEIVGSNSSKADSDASSTNINKGESAKTTKKKGLLNRLFHHKG